MRDDVAAVATAADCDAWGRHIRACCWCCRKAPKTNNIGRQFDVRRSRRLQQIAQ